MMVYGENVRIVVEADEFRDGIQDVDQVHVDGSMVVDWNGDCWVARPLFAPPDDDRIPRYVTRVVLTPHPDYVHR